MRATPPAAARPTGCAIFTASRPLPDITFYFRAPLDVAVNRIVAGRPKLKYYEAGMDLGISLDRAESFRIFQERILNNYDQMIETDHFVLMDGTVRVNKLQKLMRQIVGERIVSAAIRAQEKMKRADKTAIRPPGSTAPTADPPKKARTAAIEPYLRASTALRCPA